MTDLLEGPDTAATIDVDEAEPISDEELAALALATAADDVEIDPDAPSLWELGDAKAARLLPDWYAPANPAGTRRLRGWRRNVVFGLVVTFVAIDGLGMCTTFGPVIFGS